MSTTVRSLRRAWSTLRPLAPDEVSGDLAASFVAPLRRIAPWGLGLVGLPRWYGKRFPARQATEALGGTVQGANLVREASGALREVLPIRASGGRSLADGSAALVVTYGADAPRPWRWVRDELREAPDGTIVGMTYVDLPVLRRAGTPFLLTRVAPTTAPSAE
ncbi:hypothetical protein [Mumia zhuanghuii]|uniref:Uncharacterized protein n=1 Tax=Mumia zhuanghuii TaxID=2585211 RepID=A0A5C4MTR2_9ACTN|nr:hypothetical protein [Mumia zhuanghuii]TNC48065.1 hypothetical protein FHE65_08015 [Mumia zhuanghuii]TNC50978.1 hypothetical protein FHE65_03130 [Mumia zhuanghuii]